MRGATSLAHENFWAAPFLNNGRIPGPILRQTARSVSTYKAIDQNAGAFFPPAESSLYSRSFWLLTLDHRFFYLSLYQPSSVCQVLSFPSRSGLRVSCGKFIFSPIFSSILLFFSAFVCCIFLVRARFSLNFLTKFLL